ncbi:hypothetical protein CEXT_568351 [Caerostris extrusa]|uniref:Uncharacterized protein n=1 Tax=Caerostris extrusa TaxID=172846 RepID=A0AAV4XYR4_CAEEX|nr:hypothetical protein CEXT_568351 [Caerostris extrusa]
MLYQGTVGNIRCYRYLPIWFATLNPSIQEDLVQLTKYQTRAIGFSLVVLELKPVTHIDVVHVHKIRRRVVDPTIATACKDTEPPNYLIEKVVATLSAISLEVRDIVVYKNRQNSLCEQTNNSNNAAAEKIVLSSLTPVRKDETLNL